MKVTPSGFGRMTYLLMEMANELCQGRLVLALEGGYSSEAIQDSVTVVLQELTGQSTLDQDEMKRKEDSQYGGIAEAIEGVKEIQRRYWKSL